jgi:hypothetical protein
MSDHWFIQTSHERGDEWMADLCNLFVLASIVIIFDWDDTLLASSFLSSRGYRLDSEMEVFATTFR